MVASRVVAPLLLLYIVAASALQFGLKTTGPAIRRCATGPSALADESSPLARIGNLNPFAKKSKAGPLTTGLDSMLKDAPLAVKLAGQLIKPLAGMLETAIAESQGDAEDLLDEAAAALRSDPRVMDLLGGSPTVGAVFSQASSSSSINGKSSRQLQLQFSVGGGGAVAAASGRSEESGRMRLQELRLQAAGQVINVQLLRGGGGGRRDGGGDDGIVDVEAR